MLGVMGSNFIFQAYLARPTPLTGPEAFNSLFQTPPYSWKLFLPAFRISFDVVHLSSPWLGTLSEIFKSGSVLFPFPFPAQAFSTPDSWAFPDNSIMGAIPLEDLKFFLPLP